MTAFLAAHPYLEGLWTGGWCGLAAGFMLGKLDTWALVLRTIRKR